MKRLRKSLVLIVLVVISVEVILIFTGALDLVSAVKIVLLIGLPLFGFVAFELYVVARAVRAAKSSGQDLPIALEAALSEFFPRAVARYLRQDFMLLRAIGMLITRRRDVAAGEQLLRYSSPLVYMLSAIAVVDGAVAIALHMLLPPGWIRTLILVLGVLGLIWLVGFIASLIVYPHTISDSRLRLRFSVFHDIAIPVENIRSAQKFRDDPGSTNSAACVDGKLIMVVAARVNIKLEMDEIPELAALNHKLAGQSVSEILFYTDDEKTVREVFPHITSSPGLIRWGTGA
ncbi:hypothetical protein [Nesterenkonia ebinurensis]|uniref:hypothetical protein n=1 Tax=Nesterenkonia ebinurensis TaxID=2608252 RepID=UPI00123D1413|nr:hypothetical protein [Nesterenkonia ebinurensis]